MDDLSDFKIFTKGALAELIADIEQKWHLG